MGKAQLNAKLDLARKREKQVLELRTAGYDYDTIAQQVGYEGPGSAYKAWKRAIDRIPAEALSEHRTSELIRLERLQRSIWKRALENQDPKLISQIIKIMGLRVALLGLASRQSVEEAITNVADAIQAINRAPVRPPESSLAGLSGEPNLDWAESSRISNNGEYSNGTIPT